jgi:hypothetical protein
MPKIKPNVRIIQKAINGPKGVYGIDGHPGLFLAVFGKDARGSWRIRYQPAPGAQQRWFTLSTDARNASFDAIAHRAAEILSDVKLRGIDPHAAREDKKRAGLTYNDVYAEWLAYPGRKRALRPRTLEHYKYIHKLHIAPHVGDAPIRSLDKQTITKAVERSRQASTDRARGYRGLQATKALRLMRSVFEYAIDREYVAINPTRGVRDPVPHENPAGKQNRPLSNTELGLVWQEAPNRMASNLCAFCSCWSCSVNESLRLQASGKMKFISTAASCIYSFQGLAKETSHGKTSACRYHLSPPKFSAMLRLTVIRCSCSRLTAKLGRSADIWFRKRSLFFDARLASPIVSGCMTRAGS